MANLENSNNDIQQKRMIFKLKFKSVLWILVHGSQMIVILWFRKSAVFYLPPGWFGPAQRFLSWPFAPAGSVSVAVWFAACRRMIKAVALAINDFVITTRISEEKIA
ncbi:unnamed protein product [Rhizopus stolonifer]